MRDVKAVLLGGLLMAAAPAAGRPDEPAPADLAELSLEELMNVTVVGASKFEQRMSEAPASVTVVTRDEIVKLGYRSLADVLRGQRDFQVAYDRNYSYVGVRGFGRTGDYNTRVLLLVDGHRVNENIYDAVYVGNDALLDVELIERVEFIRGAGSSLYGDNAFFGVINVVTRRGGALSPAELSGEAASQGTYQGRAIGGHRFGNGLQFLIAASRLDSAGADRYYREFDAPGQNGGVAEGLDDEKNFRLFGNLSYGDFTLQAAYVSREKGIPTAAWEAVFNDPRFLSVDNRGYLDLKYSHAFGRVGVEARVFFDHYDFYAVLPWQDVSGPPVILNRDYARNQWWGASLQLTTTLLERHRLLGGLEYQGNLTQRFENHDVDPYFQYIDLNRTTRRWALFLQDQYTILDSLILNAGVRFDQFDTFGGAISPRVAVIYSPFEKTILKLIYGEAFRAPNNYELFYASAGYAMAANPSLRPEKVLSHELALEQLLGDHLRLTATAFTSRITRLISAQIDPTSGDSVFRNTGGARTTGGGAELEGLWSNGLKGSLSYTYQEARDHDTGDVLVNSPRHLAKGRVTIPLLAKKVFASPEVQYMSRRRTIAGDDVSGFAIANLTVHGQDLPGGLEVTGSVYNLFDTRYGDPGGDEHLQDVIQQDGRTFRIKLTYRF